MHPSSLLRARAASLRLTAEPLARILGVFTIYSVVRERGGDRSLPRKLFGAASLGRDAAAGGAERDRTVDLRLAKPALSQLSYSPKEWARAELNCRPHAYQACALTT